MEQGNEKQSERMVCPRNPRAIYEFLWVGQMTKLHLTLKLRYKPLRG
jgi:hypothetical protein